MRALVTGATGMLGYYVARRLRREGWEVRAVCRRPERAEWLGAFGVEVVPGDLVEPDSIREAARGCMGVIHAAAEVGSRGDSDRFWDINVGGTDNVVKAVSSSGARMIHVSSTAVFGQARYRTAPTHEDVPLPDLPSWDVYGRTKQEAERIVLDSHRRGIVSAVVVRPPIMYGVRDRQFAPRIGPVLERGFFPLIGGGCAKLNLVHADAVAQGAVRALTTDAADGRVYHLTTDFDLTVADLARYASEALGRRIRTPEVPLLLGRGGFQALSLALMAFGRRDLARHAAGTLDMLTRDNPFDCTRASAELGWAPELHPSRGLVEAFRWWQAHRSGPDGAVR